MLRADDALSRGFREPPPSARPQVFWAWMNGNVTREGITADLEAMRRIGVGGTMLFNLTVGIPAGPVDITSEQWRQMIVHAANEAARLGLEFSVHNGAGWSATGGPWNKVEDSMQVVTTSETTVRGPARFNAALPQPKSNLKFYRDLATLAFPIGAAELPQPTIHTAGLAIESARLMDEDWATHVELPMPQADKPAVLDIVYPWPVTVRTLYIVTGPGRSNHWGDVQSSADGQTFKTLRTFRISEYGGNSLRSQFSIEPTTARHLRVRFTKPGPKSRKLLLAEIGFHDEPRIDDLAAKAGSAWNQAGMTPSTDAAPAGIKRGAVMNLTDRIKDGVLTWDVPEGAWRIARIGYTTTGSRNHPAPSAGAGLECDKLSKAALEKHWAGMLDQVIALAGPNVGGKGITGTFTDSWEVGYQNWTPAFLDEFRKRRGYDPGPWLAVLAGHVVESRLLSERFLWDWRRTTSDLFSENFFAHQKTLAARKGMSFYCEAYGTNFDYMQCGGQSDMPIGEAWFGRPDAHRYTVKMAASTAHVYGIKRSGCEVFTTREDFGRWMNHPYQLKAFGDLKWCEGINTFVIHAYAHQPWMDKAPGMTYGECGIQFQRTNTWWEEGRAWIDYIRRAQFLLQEGNFAGDVLWFTGENTPNIPRLRGEMKPPLPAGHDFSHCDVHALLDRASARDNRIVFPDGVSYRYLLLGDNEEMSLPVARKVRELAQNGATIIGGRPLRTPGLTDYPKADVELAAIAEELWGKNADAAGQRTVGKGRVIRGRTFEEIFAADKLEKDFAFTGDAKLNYIRHRAGDTDIFFVAHEGEQAANAMMSFRVSGKKAELWWPDTGVIETCPEVKEAGGLTRIPLRFDPSGSVFVVFRDAPTPGARPRQRLTFADVQALDGPWEVSFEPGRGAPAVARFEKLIPWNEHSDLGIKYFSGHATYRMKFTAPQGRPLFLDLGDVQVMASVKLNGKDLGILWKPPFRVELTDALKAGDNDLEVMVVNLWVNRLIGDEQHPADAKRTERTGVMTEWPDWYLKNLPRPHLERLTFTTFQPFTKDSPLVASGLLGPVKLLSAAPAVER